VVAARGEEHAVRHWLRRVGAAPVVEPGLADHPEADPSPHRLDAPHDVVLVGRGGDWHVVRDLGDTVLGEKAREQHARIGQVELLLARAVEQRRDPETAPVLVVEQGREHGWRVELGHAHEVDRPVHADERNRVEVADDAVVLDRLVGHALPPGRPVCHGQRAQLAPVAGRPSRPDAPLRARGAIPSAAPPDDPGRLGSGGAPRRWSGIFRPISRGSSSRLEATPVSRSWPPGCTGAGARGGSTARSRRARRSSCASACKTATSRGIEPRLAPVRVTGRAASGRGRARAPAWCRDCAIAGSRGDR